jgi:excisionase family DNA binding protein
MKRFRITLHDTVDGSPAVDGEVTRDATARSNRRRPVATTTVSDDDMAERPPVGTERCLLTADVIAEWLGVSRQAIYRMTRERRLPTVAVGRYYRYDPIAVERWIMAGGAGPGYER